MKAHLQSYPHIAMLYASCTRLFTIGILLGFNIPVFLLVVYSWREQAVSLISSVSSICLSIILSEVLLFITFFWYRLTHSLSIQENSIISQSPWGLVLTITLLLATASCFTSYRSLLSDKSIDSGVADIILILLTSLFCLIQVSELLSSQLYINNGTASTASLFLTNLHCSHVAVGSIILLFSQHNPYWLYLPSYSYRVLNGSGVVVLPKKDTCVLLYWHFVEIVWLFIQFVLYSE